MDIDKEMSVMNAKVAMKTLEAFIDEICFENKALKEINAKIAEENKMLRDRLK